MKNFPISDNFWENQQNFSKILCKKQTQGFLLLKDVIRLSPKDTLKLCHQLNCINCTEDFHDFCLCVIISWAASIKNNQKNSFSENMLERCSRIPQHSKGAYLHICQDTFLEYGLEIFDSKFTSMQEIEELIKKHVS